MKNALIAIVLKVLSLLLLGLAYLILHRSLRTWFR
jgi:hypothetical protein